MDETSSEDNDFIDSMMALIDKEGIVQTERAKNTSLGEANVLKIIYTGKETLLGNLINEAEVVLEDGLSINDVMQEEVIVSMNEFDFDKPGTSYQNNLWEHDQPTKNNDCSMYLNATNEAFTNINNSSINNESNEEDFDDPDFEPVDDVIMDDSSENHSIISPNKRDTQESIENNANAHNTPNEFTNNSKNDLCAIEAINDEGNNRQRKRNKRPDRSSWDVNIHKRLRMTGKKYLGYKKVKVNGKVTVKRSETEHEERKMGPMCSSKICKSNKKRKCTEISEETRRNIFKGFWRLSWNEKKVYIRDHMKKSDTQQKTVKEKTSRRSGTYKYYLSTTTGDLKPVCKLMCLNTLGIKEWMAQNWVKGSKEDSSENVMDTPPTNSVDPPRENTKERKVSDKKKVISEWLNALPKVPSHYCRASSSKLYLEPIWNSKVDLHNKYKKFCTENNKPCGSITLFMEVFEEQNLSIYIPKKDQCDECYAYKAGNISKEIYDKHIQEKELARAEKENDKQKAIAGEIYCLTADVESVKLTPMTKASAMYYKTKLCSHNYTVYNLASRHCKCYWFSEVEGDLSANTFASCLIDYLREHCLNQKLPIVVYTDGCTNQNRNQYLSNALLHFAVQNEVQLTQKFLVKGHTQMEGDSVHARIESRIKGKDVYVPYEYVKYTKEARQTPFPYEAIYLSHTFFLNYSKINYYNSVRPGNRKGDPVVMDVHCFKYDPNGKVQFKLSFTDEFADLPRRPNKVNGDWGLPPVVCDFYIAMDVMCSTSSIFNLVAISIDRYIAVTQPIKYAKHKNNRRIWLTIMAVWLISVAIGTPIVLGLNNTPDRIPDLCVFYNSDFIIYSSLSSFYIPCIIMVFLYYSIFKALRNRAKKQKAARKPNLDLKPGIVIENVAQTRRLAETTLVSSARIPSSTEDAPTNTGSGSQDEDDDGDDRSPGPEDCHVIPNDKSTEFILSTVVEETVAVGTLATPPVADEKGNNDSGYAASQLEDVAAPGSTPASPPHRPLPPAPPEERTVQKPPSMKRNGSTTEAAPCPSAGAAARRALSASTRTASEDECSGSKKERKASAGTRFTIYKVNKASRKKREKSSAKKERKATKTLAIVLGVFLFCWVPFFTCNVMDAICTKLGATCQPSLAAFIITTWLGYMNSFVNPVIYTIFNPEFRKAFKKLMNIGT